MYLLRLLHLSRSVTIDVNQYLGEIERKGEMINLSELSAVEFLNKLRVYFILSLSVFVEIFILEVYYPSLTAE